MKLLEVKELPGRNIHCHRPVLEITLDLEDLAGRETCEFDNVAEDIVRFLPGLSQHSCGMGYPGGFIDRVREGTYFGHLFEHLVLELQQEAGMDCRYGKTRVISEPRIYRVVVEYSLFKPAQLCLQLALQIISAVTTGEDFDKNSSLENLRRTAARYQLGPSTAAIMDAARLRGIPVMRLHHPFSILQLGTGVYQRRVQATVTDSTSCMAVDMACDKTLTKEVLSAGGIPTPPGKPVSSPEQALEVAVRVGFPVVVKPGDGNQGKGVSLNLTGEKEIADAYDLAASFSKQVIVEKYIPGKNYRLLVVDGELVAAAERTPAMVTGDGRHSIRELVTIINQDPRRGYGHEKELTRINLDKIVEQVLSRRGYSVDSIPGAGEKVLLRENANLSSGGTAVDVTDKIHPDNAELAVKAAELIGLDIAGVDFVTRDISLPLRETEGAVIEVNAAPGIRMHHYPSQGQPRDVAGRIVDMLFTPGSRSSIPVFAVTGTNGKTTTSRLLAAIATDAGFTTGLTTTDGTFVGDRLVRSGDNTGPASARMLLMDKKIELAVLETARGGIVRGGLGYDLADVAVVTNISEDHLGVDGLETIDDLVFVKSLVVEAVRKGGTVVLNAGDANVVKMVSRIPEGVETVFFGMEPDNVVIRRHVSEGGRAVFVSRNRIVLAQGGEVSPLIAIEKIPITMGGRALFNVENVLASVAAAVSFGIDPKTVAATLERFSSSRDNPGRCNLFNLGGINLVLDYGHNPAGIEQMLAWGRKMAPKRLVLVLGVPGDRKDDLIREAGRRAAGADYVIVKEDKDLRGRSPGEVATLLKEGLTAAGMPAINIRVELNEAAALAEAVNNASPGDMIILFYEKLAPVQSQIEGMARQYTPAACSRSETATSGA